MEAFLVSTLAVAIAEIGDKTQLLAFILAAKFRKPLPIILGIFCATLINHAIAGAAGEWISKHLSPEVIRWSLAAIFAAVAVWTLKADSLDEEPKSVSKYGAFLATLVTFFFAEIGDKTQVATVALAVKFHNLPAVVAGTTLGMMLANVPAVFVGNALREKIPMHLFRYIAAAIFAIMAVVTLLY